MTHWKDLSVQALSDMTARAEPMPAGGSVCALTAAFCAALCQMTAGLVLRRGLHDTTATISRCAVLRLELLDLMQQDGEAYSGYLAAKRAAPGEGSSGAVQEALMVAVRVPLRIAQITLEVASLLRQSREYVPKAAVADLQAGLLLAQAAARGSLLAARVNALTLENAEDRSSIRDIIQGMQVQLS